MGEIHPIPACFYLCLEFYRLRIGYFGKIHKNQLPENYPKLRTQKKEAAT